MNRGNSRRRKLGIWYILPHCSHLNVLDNYVSLYHAFLVNDQILINSLNSETESSTTTSLFNNRKNVKTIWETVSSVMGLTKVTPHIFFRKEPDNNYIAYCILCEKNSHSRKGGSTSNISSSKDGTGEDERESAIAHYYEVIFLALYFILSKKQVTLFVV
ncbi:10222_t:CDS:2 [Ambispora gerdemannii]|uniref:10222_t:CDS:1 n=1 Tax=Ambispora gerdemannii TaxID=144530 RepID=A0A9N8YWM1_9GLOM|nr:10222_t:CDS:2 [Ambispora gerdemannii]